MFLENLGPKTSLSVPNWWRDCRTIESITYNPGTLYSGLHYKDKGVKSVQEKQNHNLTLLNLTFMKLCIPSDYFCWEATSMFSSYWIAYQMSHSSIQNYHSLDIHTSSISLFLNPCTSPTHNFPESILLYQSLSQTIQIHFFIIVSTPIHPAQKINFYLLKLWKR